MRKSRIALGLVVAACAFGVVAAPALAFGKFHASIKGQTLSEGTPGTVKGRGEVERFVIGPYMVKCPRGIKAQGNVISEEFESFFTEITFGTCEARSKPEGGSGGKIREVKKVHFKLAMEFLSNYSAAAGEGESEIRIKYPSEVSFKAGGSQCIVIIPAQSIPLKQKPDVEYESAVPETEEELLEGRHAIEKYGEYRKWLDFEIDLKRLRAKLKPNSKCVYEEEEPGEGKYNPETGYVEWSYGVFEGDLEEMKLKKGNVWFEEE